MSNSNESKLSDARVLPPAASDRVTVGFLVREFPSPPIRDALVLGKRSWIGCVAIRKAIVLLQASQFEHIEFEDDVISDIIARDAIVRLIGRESLIRHVVQRIKPLMSDRDIMHLDVEVCRYLAGE